LILNGEDLLWLVWSCLTASAPRPQEVFVVHANAPLNVPHRLAMARLIVEDGLSVSPAAQWFQVAWPTAKRWAERYREEGAAGMADRSSRPHHSPTKTRCGLHRLAHLDRVTGEPIRRYEYPHPGDLLHVDVKKLGNIPDGGVGATSDASKVSAIALPPLTSPTTATAARRRAPGLAGHDTADRRVAAAPAYLRS
jgi:hypothetical protein